MTKQYNIHFGDLFVDANSEEEAIETAKKMIELDISWLTIFAEAEPEEEIEDLNKQEVNKMSEDENQTDAEETAETEATEEATEKTEETEDSEKDAADSEGEPAHDSGETEDSKEESTDTE